MWTAFVSLVQNGNGLHVPEFALPILLSAILALLAFVLKRVMDLRDTVRDTEAILQGKGKSDGLLVRFERAIERIDSASGRLSSVAGKVDDVCDRVDSMEVRFQSAEREREKRFDAREAELRRMFREFNMREKRRPSDAIDD